MVVVKQTDPIRPNVPDHELLQPIGRGSYGEVWLARSVLGTLRAIKIVRRDDFSNARPFEREFAGIQHVEPLSRGHEGLVDILHVGRAADDSFFYYVMELADPITDTETIDRAQNQKPYSPRTLGADLARRGRLTPSQCIDIFHGLAMALGHLHREGLVHRDIKPSNIIFVGGIPKLADIGLVASADDAPSYVGTEGYIPQEGAGSVLADIYSLGKVLYEAGTGRDRTEFPALPPDVADLSTSHDLLELNAVWLKACATAPADRYQSIDELAADLALLRAGRSVKRLRLVETRLRSARRFAVVLAVLAVLIFIGLWITRTQAATERTNRLAAEVLRRRAEEAEHQARQLLVQAKVGEIRAVLKSQQIGRRAAALALLTDLPPPQNPVELRNLAATALSLPDLSPLDETVADSSTNSFLISPQPDGAIQVRLSNGETRRIVSMGEKVRLPLELSGDERFLYAGYGRLTERIWDLSTGLEVARLGTNYYELSFRPQHPEVAVSYINGEISLHHLPGWEIERTWTNMAGGTLKWDDAGRRLLLEGSDTRIQLLNPESGQTKELGKINSPIETLIWHPDGRHVLVGADDGYVRVKDVDSWDDFSLLARHEAQVVDAVFLPPFPWVLTSSWDGTSRLWDWQAGQELGRMEATSHYLKYDATRHRLSWRLETETNSSAWQLTGSDVWRQFFSGNPHQTGGPFMTSFSGDSRLVVTPDNEGIRVWDIASGNELLHLPVYAQAAWINHNGTELFANGNGAIRHWLLAPVAEGGLEASETPSLGKAGPEGRLAVDASGKVICWIDGPNLFISREGAQKSLPHEIDVAETISISPNGAIVAVGTRNRVGVKVFEVDTGKKLWEAAIGKGTHLAFSSDSQWLAVGTDNGCHVYSANSGKVRWELIPGQHEQPCFWEVAFSPDGKYVAWTPKPSQVQILSASDGSEVLTLDYPCRRYITGLGFSPDGRWLAETSNEHNLHLWNLKELHHQLDSYGLGW